MLVGPVRQSLLPDTLDIPRAARMARKGSGWPNGRGWLHETASCVAAVEYWWELEDYWRGKLGMERNR